MTMEPLTAENARAAAEKFIATISPCPNRFAGRGIVICGGGMRYFTCAWVCINMLRRVGCHLPIQLWHLGPKEMTDHMKFLLKPLGVECVDGLEVREKHPARILNGWELKAYSIIHSPFKEVLLLDADNVCTINPEFLFGTDEFKKTGAIFWPDYGRLEPERPIWALCGVEYRNEPEFETGQIVLDKERCWETLCLTMWYNEYSDFFYQYIHGDKETFHLAFRKLAQPYSMPRKPIHTLQDTMCQHDFEGNRIFQHRNLDKWNLLRGNKHIDGFLHEKECCQYLDELRHLWDGRNQPVGRDFLSKTEHLRATAKRIIGSEFDYHRVGHDRRSMTFLESGVIDQGAAGSEVFWDLNETNEGVILEILSGAETTCRLKEDAEGVWRGKWLHHEQMPIELSVRRRLQDAASSEFHAGPSHKVIFDGIYQNKIWGDGSGPGSRVENTTDYRAYLERFMEEKKIQSVLDVGCGDWEFSQHVHWNGAIYFGVDVSSLAIAKASAHLGDRVMFACADFLHLPIVPRFHLAIVKDVLQHLDYPNGLRLLSKLAECRFLLITNDASEENGVATTGGYHFINPLLEPFCMQGKCVLEWTTAETPKRTYLIENW